MRVVRVAAQFFILTKIFGDLGPALGEVMVAVVFVVGVLQIFAMENLVRLAGVLDVRVVPANAALGVVNSVHDAEGSPPHDRPNAAIPGTGTDDDRRKSIRLPQ